MKRNTRTTDLQHCADAIVDTLAGLLYEHSASTVAIALGLSMNATLQMARDSGACTEADTALFMHDLTLLQARAGDLPETRRHLNA